MKILVLGAGGFIGHHLAAKLAAEGHEVHGVDLKLPSYSLTEGVFASFELADLSDPEQCRRLFLGRRYEECYQLAADMGGAGYIFTGENDIYVMMNSVRINLNTIEFVKADRTFYASSACIYPAHAQEDPLNPDCREDTAYPANPDSEYGWEKLFSERLYFAASRNYGRVVRVGRYHNVYGPEGTYKGGREKAPAAICRKVAEAADGGTVEVWGDGEQTRSFLYITDAVDATIKFMRGDFAGPINIGSEEMVSINKLVALAAQAAGKDVNISHVPGPLGVRGRNSFNDLIREKLGWEPKVSLEEGIAKTYAWIAGRNN